MSIQIDVLSIIVTHDLHAGVVYSAEYFIEE
jgi:hypothetical protein